jgi:hypothetical protein
MYTTYLGTYMQLPPLHISVTGRLLRIELMTQEAIKISELLDTLHTCNYQRKMRSYLSTKIRSTRNLSENPNISHKYKGDMFIFPANRHIMISAY